MNESKNFYERREWLNLRYSVLRKYGFACMGCGDKSSQLHVDHIKPKSIYPELALEFDNLQVLCRACNLGKSNKYTDDLRWSGKQISPPSNSQMSKKTEDRPASPEAEAFIKSIREMMGLGKKDQQ